MLVIYILVVFGLRKEPEKTGETYFVLILGNSDTFCVYVYSRKSPSKVVAARFSVSFVCEYEICRQKSKQS